MTHRNPWLRSVENCGGAIKPGPSMRFIRLTRDPDMTPPKRFEPTVKADGDVVL